MFKISEPFKKIYLGPTAAFLIGASFNIHQKIAKMNGVKRVIFTLPAHIAAIVPLAFYPVAMLVDRLVKPIFNAVNWDYVIEKTAEGNAARFEKRSISVGEKAVAFLAMVPKLVLTAPIAVLTAAVGAAALPIIFGVAVVKSFMGKALVRIPS